MTQVLQVLARYAGCATAIAATWMSIVAPASAQVKTAPSLAPVNVTAKANRDPVEKSYRKMISGVDLFEKERATAPNAALRFKLLPRRRDTNMSNIDLAVVGQTVEFAMSIAPDYTFTMPRNAQALAEDAQVIPNRKAQSMTWRTDIRTPGLPPNTRRLGDLRLECRVGMQAGLVSTRGGLIGWIAGALTDTPSYCGDKAPQYLFFADRALFSVTLVAGARREILPITKLYANASDDPNLPKDLPDCDCEVLIDRTYFLPLGDRSWPDDALVEFDYMEGE